jgi:hypothetical protein
VALPSYQQPLHVRTKRKTKDGLHTVSSERACRATETGCPPITLALLEQEPSTKRKAKPPSPIQTQRRLLAKRKRDNERIEINLHLSHLSAVPRLTPGLKVGFFSARLRI